MRPYTGTENFKLYGERYLRPAGWGAGVREYWIVNPARQVVQTYFFEEDEEDGFGEFSFEEDIPVRIYPSWSINIGQLLEDPLGGGKG